MKSHITITPATNVEGRNILSNKQLEDRVYDTDMDTLTFYNKRNNKLWRGNLNHVSLYEDVIVEGDVHYIIVKMLTKK